MSISFTQSLSCGSDSTKAGLEGALSGLLGVVGLGGVVSAIPGMDTEKKTQDALAAAQQNLQTQTTKWQSAIQDMKTQVIEDQIGNLQSLITASANQQYVIDETLSEKTQSNALLISMLVALVFFLVMYDVI